MLAGTREICEARESMRKARRVKACQGGDQQSSHRLTQSSFRKKSMSMRRHRERSVLSCTTTRRTHTVSHRADTQSSEKGEEGAERGSRLRAHMCTATARAEEGESSEGRGWWTPAAKGLPNSERHADKTQAEARGGATRACGVCSAKHRSYWACCGAFVSDDAVARARSCRKA